MLTNKAHQPRSRHLLALPHSVLYGCQTEGCIMTTNVLPEVAIDIDLRDLLGAKKARHQMKGASR
jgi:hypothetical protein